MKPAWFLPAALLLAACPAKREEHARATSAAPDEGPAFDAPTMALPPDQDAGASALESAHHAVFADRTSQAYLLLLDEPSPEKPEREALIALVKDRLAGGKYEAELAGLERLIAQPPPPPGFEGLPEDEKDRLRREDLLGLHIDLLPVAALSDDPLISVAVLTDPILARDLTAGERDTAAHRKWAVLLRADYRNMLAVRGLRMLQTLVQAYATEHGALIHDPDTSETMNVAAFTRRRLQASLGNIADQIAVVPFPEADGTVRMTTRGMRRFGSVDLELDGLPRSPRVLDRATFLLIGLAYKMARMGEYDERGFAIEVDDVIALARDDIAHAFGGRAGKIPACDACTAAVNLHLVERPPKPTDPHEHVVARVVAPRVVSDAGDYVQPAWAQSAMVQLLGPLSE